MNWLVDPVDWWITPFTDNPFLRDALWAALLSVCCTSVIGTWVVLRGLSFLGDALAHGVLPGIAIAFVMGGNTTVGALLAALAMVVGVQVIRAASPLPDDASIGVLFVGFLALAVVVMSAQARLIGFRPQLTHFALLVLLALSIVASFETVGSLLVFAFLIAPPSTATLLVKRVPLVMCVAVLIGSACALVGLLVSYHHDTATGATMALVTVIVFLVALLARQLARGIGRRSLRLTSSHG